jgi:hypothetical protein
MTYTSHLFKGPDGQISEVAAIVADDPEEWDSLDEAGQPGWSVDRGVPTIAIRLTRPDGKTARLVVSRSKCDRTAQAGIFARLYEWQASPN